MSLRSPLLYRFSGLVLLLVLLFLQPGLARATSAYLSPREQLLQRINSNTPLNLHNRLGGNTGVGVWPLLNEAGGPQRFTRPNQAPPKPPFPPRKPRASDPMDVYWDNRFGIPGSDSTPLTMATQGSNLFVGGYMYNVNGVPVYSIAKWDGTTWSPMGTGVNGTPEGMVVSGTDLYVAGNFLEASGVSVNNIAKWDGSHWSALGSGLDGVAWAIATMGSDIYVGGSFSTAGGIPANYIAKWDGTSWSALGSGVDGEIYAMTVSGTDIYVAGNFTTAGEVPASHLAKWSTTSNTWSALGSGMDYYNQVNVLAANGDDIYVGGHFTSAGGTPANSIAKWNATTQTWSALGQGLNNGTYVYALLVMGNDLYVGGDFTSAGNVTATGIARWDGANWYAVGGGVGGDDTDPASSYFNSYVTSMTAGPGILYIGGNFTIAGSVPAAHLARWDGNNWSSFTNATSNGFSGGYDAIAAITANGGNIYAGGRFLTAGNILANNIAKWDGATWSALGAGVSGCPTYYDYLCVKAIAVSGNNVYVAGSFTSAGGMAVSNIAKWDGTSWSALGSGTNNTITALAVNGTDLYAAGYFTVAGGIGANHIAKWSTTANTWSALGNGITGVNLPYIYVNALAVMGNNVFVGGRFNHAGTVKVNNIAKWNGTTWSQVGAGVDGTINAFAVSGTTLYAGGDISQAGAVTVWNVAQWSANGGWKAVGKSWVNPPLALTMSGSVIYLGTYYVDGFAATPFVYKFDGSSWIPLGSGTDQEVTALAANGHDVYAGGYFASAGGKPAYKFGIWHDPTPLTPALLKPANNAKVNTKRPVLDWSDSSGATSYQVQVRRTSTTGVLVVNTSTPSSQFQTPILLGGGRKYFWRVRACMQSACSLWTSFWSFTVTPP